MASKRTFDEEDHQGNDDRDLQGPAKRRHGDPQEAEAMRLAFLSLSFNFLLLLWLMCTIASCLVPVIRNGIKEEIQSVLQGYACLRCRLSLNQQGSGGTSGGRAMQLCVVNRLPPEIFTMVDITAEDGGPLQIELRYAASQQRVVTSNMKVQICVLDGDFGKDGNEEWTAEEFNLQTVKPREGKGPLLRGDTIIKLENGVACINRIVFTDNSSGMRSKTFRLGVIILQSNSVGTETDIREGRSEAFKVKDKRGESYKKHDRPSLNDEVWRLKSIGKGGPLDKELFSHGIQTVQHLLRLNTTGSLQEKFGNKYNWDKIIAHAKHCELDDDERYIYTYHATEQLPPVSLVFNCIYEVVEVMFYGQRRSLQSLNSKDKRLVERVKQEAYNNLKNLVPIETQTHDIMMKLTQEASSYSAPDQGLQQLFLPPQQGQLETWPSTSTSIIDEAANGALVDPSDQLRALRGKVPLNLSAVAHVVPEEAYINIDNGNGWEQFESYLTADQWEQLDSCSYPYGGGASCSNHSFFLNTAVKEKKSKTVWQKIRKIRNALKWLIPHMA